MAIFIFCSLEDFKMVDFINYSNLSYFVSSITVHDLFIILN